jgi:hypothetical protein
MRKVIGRLRPVSQDSSRPVARTDAANGAKWMNGLNRTS